MKQIPNDFKSYFELIDKNVINDPKLFNAKLFELEILRTDETERNQLLTDLFYDLLSLLPNHFRKSTLIFLMRPFENIAKLENDFQKTQI
jgi:hypothetical protein